MTTRRALLLAGLWLAGCDKQRVAFRNTDISDSRLGGEWNVQDFHGRPQKLNNFQGKVLVLFFGYTSCPDICPSALSKYAALLRAEGIASGRVQLVFCTVDPARDSASRLREYLTWFHPDILGLAGDERQIADFSRHFRVVAQKKEIPGSMGYVIDHTAGAYVFDPAGRLRLYLAENARLDDIIADVQQLLAGY